MKKIQGFTLIELLAVIVILAVIALIATPIIMNVIKDSQKGAFQDSAYGIIKSGELYYSTNLVKGQVEGKTFDFSGDVSLLKFKGEKPGGGNLKISSNGKIAMAIYDKGKNWCITKKESSEDITIKDYEEGKCNLVVEATDVSCFEFSNHTITSYKCGKYVGAEWHDDFGLQPILGDDGLPLQNTGTVIEDVVIPEQINGQTVTNIADTAFAFRGIKSVTISKTVTTIGRQAFYQNPLITADLGATTSLSSLGYESFVTGYQNDEGIYQSPIHTLVLPNVDPQIYMNGYSYYDHFTTQHHAEWAPNYDGVYTKYRVLKGTIPVSDFGEMFFGDTYCNKLTEIEDTETYTVFEGWSNAC